MKRSLRERGIRSEHRPDPESNIRIAGAVGTSEHGIVQSMQAICEYIRSRPAEKLPLRDLAARAGLSPFHFLRTFRKAVGLTPKQFAESCRLQTFKTKLRTRPSVTDAIYESGFGSSSRAYEKQPLGMTPAQYRDGGRNLAISYVAVDTALGRMMIGATERGVCFLQFGERDQELLDQLRGEYPKAKLHPSQKPYPNALSQWIRGLEDHLQGRRPRIDLALDLRCTVFQFQVWSYLRTIPTGETRTYSEVAAAVGRPKAARAVARACASNRVALAIPCHRVICGGGELGGYRWGTDRKRALLEKETA